MMKQCPILNLGCTTSRLLTSILHALRGRLIRTASTSTSRSRSTLFSSARVSKTINVDGRPISSNADYQEDASCLSGSKFQDPIDNSDLLKCLIRVLVLVFSISITGRRYDFII